MKKRVLSLIISFGLILSIISFIPIISYASYTPTADAYTVVNYALSKVGTSFAANYCQGFVYQCFYNSLGVGNKYQVGCCAKNAWDNYGVSTSSSDIPLGATVYWSGSSVYCNSYHSSARAGHVGIYVGDGYVVNSYHGTVHKDTLTSISNWSGYSYLGWGWQGGYALAATDTQAPSTAKLTIKKEWFASNEPFTLSFSSNVECKYYLSVFDYDSGERIIGEDVLSSTYSNSFKRAGHYTAYMSAFNTLGSVDSNWIEFYIYADGPTYASVHADKSVLNVGECVTFTNTHNSYYAKTYMKIYDHTNGIVVDEGWKPPKYEFTPEYPSVYSATMSAYTPQSTANAEFIYFYVGDYTPPIANGRYAITTALSSDCALNVKGRSTDNYTTMLMWTDVTQTFDVTYLGNGYYSIISAVTGKALDSKDYGKNPGTDAIQYDWKNTSNQRWMIRPSGDGYYYIQNQDSNLYLDVQGGSIYNGCNVHLWSGNSTSGQKWSFVPAMHTNRVYHCVWGFRNGEGNNGDKTVFLLDETSWIGQYGTSQTYTESLLKSIRGIDSIKKIYSPNFSNWAALDFPFTFTQPASSTYAEIGYTPIQYTINYVLDGGTNNVNNPSGYNILYGVTFEMPTREGYAFKGWTDENGKSITGINEGCNAWFESSNDFYNKLNSRTIGDRTITAQWEYIPPHTQTQVEKSGNTYNISVEQINLETAKIIVAGYKGNKVFDMKILNNDNLETAFTGDFDTFKVMAWESFSNLKPLCNVEIIPKNKWIIKQ